jgi:hypothetical protein
MRIFIVRCTLNPNAILAKICLDAANIGAGFGDTIGDVRRQMAGAELRGLAEQVKQSATVRREEFELLGDRFWVK